jgi:hypothetical protein
MSIFDEIRSLQDNVKHMTSWISESSANLKELLTKQSNTPFDVPGQDQVKFGMYTAVCVDTMDPWKQGAVRCFSPLLHDPEKAQIENLPWAMPISSQGGFDDSGCTWVPPAGSKLCLVFEAGNRQRPFYLGTTWDRSRREGWGINVVEYDKIHRGHRGGYMVGTRGTAEAGVFAGGEAGEVRDEEQVFPPWNTENYNGYDYDSIIDFENDTEGRNKTTYPNIYGWKTPQKHMIKMVDGNYKCNMRWQRLEIKSAQGNHLIFKDDKVHPAPQWVNPDCGCDSKEDFSKCNDGDDPIEKPNECPTNSFGDSKPVPPKIMMIGEGKEQAQASEGGSAEGQCANPYFKHKSECRPYTGPGNPQNNRVDKTTLPQSGIQLTSLSGHSFWMDDSVSQPKGSNEWEKGLGKFDYGCDEVYKGKTVWKSAHGHQIMMSDCEPDNQPKVRGAENFIRILTATGNRIELNDDTRGDTKIAGPRRGIELQSTSGHLIQMIDNNNDQEVTERKEGGIPVSKATNAFVKIKTGYGLEVMMSDEKDQEKTQSQHIQLRVPQNDSRCGAHVIRMQASPSCGTIFVRAGGDYVCVTEGDHVTVVGAGSSTPNNGQDFNTELASLEGQLAAAQASGNAAAIQSASQQLAQLRLDNEDFCKGGARGPRNWFLAVSQHSVQWSCKFYFNVAEIHAFVAKKIILLMAGRDCPPPPDSANQDCSPCVGPVVVLLGNRLVASDRVFASASRKSITVPISSLFDKKPGENCQ